MLAWALAPAATGRMGRRRYAGAGTICRQHPVVRCASPPALRGRGCCLHYFWAADTRRCATAPRTRPIQRLLCDLHDRSCEYLCFWVLVGRGLSLLAQVGRPGGAPRDRLPGYISDGVQSWDSHTSIALVEPGQYAQLSRLLVPRPLLLRVS